MDQAQELLEKLKNTPMPELAKKEGNNVALYESLLAGQLSRAAAGESVTEQIAGPDPETLAQVFALEKKGEINKEETDFIEYFLLLQNTRHLLVTRQFIAELLQKVPELQPAYNQHVQDNQELLPYVFMGDVSRFLFVESEAHRLEVSQPLVRILNFIEKKLETNDKDIHGFIAASVVDNLVGEDKMLDKISHLIGPRLQEQFKI